MVLKSGKLIFLGCLLAAAGNGFSVTAWSGEHANSLKLSVWGGDHRAMLEHAVLNPFTALTDVSITARSRGSSQIESEFLNSDVVELELQEAIEACDNGRLKLIPGYNLSDFVPNALQPCSVGQYVWSTLYAYDRTAHRSGNHPSLITDFFNIRHYPGRRAVRRSPRVISEWAILAAGVPATQVNKILAQDELAWGIIKSALDRVSQSIVWVDDDDQAIDMLRNGTVTFAMLGSDSLVRTVLAGADNLHPVWDGSINQISLWAVPVTASDPDLAWKFVRYATSVDAARRFSAMSGYGPSRYSSLDQISSNYHLYLPSSRSNLTNIVWGNSSWWRDHGEYLDQQFANWLSRQFVKSDS